MAKNGFLQVYQNSHAVGQTVEMQAAPVTPEYYIEHFMEIMPRYIAKGRPTMDTMNTYHDRIKHFLEWCKENQRHPLAMHDYEMRIYMEQFIRTHKDSTVALTVIAIRAFFSVAQRLYLIKENPMEYIHAGSAFKMDEQFKFFTVDQIGEILNAFQKEEDDFTRTRNTAILYLMSTEGLRNVEIQRMNDEDINWDTATILVRGKGHFGVIYPSDKTMQILAEYLDTRPKSVKEGNLTPTFVSNSNRRLYRRITRNGIRSIMNKALTLCNYKEAGISCHVFRHSCGTNLYAATKDLRVVQETLRQRDPKTTARYAHVQQRMTHRYTNMLDPSAAAEAERRKENS